MSLSARRLSSPWGVGSEAQDEGVGGRAGGCFGAWEHFGLVLDEGGFDVCPGDGGCQVGGVRHGQVALSRANGDMRWTASPISVTLGTRSSGSPTGSAWL
jgi:hypothetical protein